MEHVAPNGVKTETCVPVYKHFAAPRLSFETVSWDADSCGRTRISSTCMYLGLYFAAEGKWKGRMSGTTLTSVVNLKGYLLPLS